MADGTSVSAKETVAAEQTRLVPQEALKDFDQV
jgi:hypothetical protein